MGCTTKVIKCELIIGNTIFILFGLVIVALGIFARTEFHQHLHRDIPLEPVFIIGITISMIAFFGCCGAACGSVCMICIYYVALLVIIIIQLFVVLVAYPGSFNIKVNISDALKDLFNHAEGGDATAKFLFDDLQSTLKCCGLNGPMDYTNSPFLPNSCCMASPHAVVIPCLYFNVHSDGCDAIVSNYIEYIFFTLKMVFICVVVIELIGVVFSVYLAIDMRENKKRLNEREQELLINNQN